MSPIHSLQVIQVSDVNSPSDFFFCAPLAAKLLGGACVRRQVAAAKPKERGVASPDLFLCVNCADGKALAERLGSAPVSTETPKAPERPGAEAERERERAIGRSRAKERPAPVPVEVHVDVPANDAAPEPLKESIASEPVLTLPVFVEPLAEPAPEPVEPSRFDSVLPVANDPAPPPTYDEVPRLDIAMADTSALEAEIQREDVDLETAVADLLSQGAKLRREIAARRALLDELEIELDAGLQGLLHKPSVVRSGGRKRRPSREAPSSIDTKNG